MNNQITISLNGKEVEVPSTYTIREAAKSQGIKIPTFCYDDRLKPFASCFLCVVEVEKARGMIPACSTIVTPGMVIQTDSKKVQDTRKMSLDLLLSDHAGDCVAPCETNCPSNVDIQGYIAQISNGNFEAATRLIKETNPLPIVCGRICPHPCESQCRRDLVDEKVAINPLKRFASEYELEHGPFMPETGPDTGKKVAIVGGGPAGLSAAYFLRQQGHQVTIYEALPQLGGMVRYGIPSFRLPWDKLDGEINSIIGLGVDVKFNQKLGKDFTISDLKSSGTDAVLLAIGAHKAKPMRIENEDVGGVIGGIDFLRKVVLKEKIETGKRVAVIGGGDTAMDCARVARRLGAEVTLLYRRSQKEMPALLHEQEETMEEGVEFRFLTAPTAVAAKDNQATGLQIITMELGKPDESGRRRPVPVEGSEDILPFDLIISAIGQDPDLSCVDKEKEKPEGTRWNTFVYDEKVMTTTVDGVFTAGDCAFGPDTVIRAVGEGKIAAKAINLYLSGVAVKLTKEYQISRGRLDELDEADFSPRFVHKKRALETTFPVEHRLANDGYNTINAGLTEVQALAESTRCIECGCSARFNCDLRDYSTEYGATETKLAGEKRSYVEDIRNPFIKIESDKCITCASCVRICSEVREISALAFVERGFATKIAPNFEDSLQEAGCDACGMCIDVCPTGSMAHNVGKEVGPWRSEKMISTCTSCARGCGLTVHTRHGQIVKVTSVDGDPVNGSNICIEGRFAFQLEETKKQRGIIDQSALSKAAQASINDAKSLAVIVSPTLTVEAIFAAKLLCDEKNGTLHYLQGSEQTQSKNPYSKLHGKANIALLSRLGATNWDKQSSDCIVVIGATLDNKPENCAKLISLNTYEAGVIADTKLVIPDPLRTEGSFLTETGDLALLSSKNTATIYDSALVTISLLANNSIPSSVEDIRSRLVEEVSEFKGLEQGSSTRLIKTNLAPLIADIKGDSRELVFANHVKAKGL